MIAYTCDRCGKPTDDPKHHRVLGTDEPLATWKNHFGTPVEMPTALRTHVKVSISAPGVDDNLELCPRCFADLTVAAVDTLDLPDTQQGPTEADASRRTPVEPNVRMVALLKPDAGRCHCESMHCHDRADCHHAATVEIDAFGHRQSLCDECAVKAVVADVLRQVVGR